jgi:hypothetical protein
MADGTISPCVFSPFGVAGLSEIESFSRLLGSTNGNRRRFKNLQDALTNQETLVFYREQQAKIKDRFRPCVLIDHPDYAREIFAENHCFETNNTPADYFSGRTADIIDQRAKEWKEVWSPKLREYAESLVAKKLEETLGGAPQKGPMKGTPTADRGMYKNHQGGAQWLYRGNMGS